MDREEVPTHPTTDVSDSTTVENLPPPQLLRPTPPHTGEHRLFGASAPNGIQRFDGTGTPRGPSDRGSIIKNRPPFGECAIEPLKPTASSPIYSGSSGSASSSLSPILRPRCFVSFTQSMNGVFGLRGGARVPRRPRGEVANAYQERLSDLN